MSQYMVLIYEDPAAYQAGGFTPPDPASFAPQVAATRAT